MIKNNKGKEKLVSDRVRGIQPSAIHEMTGLASTFPKILHEDGTDSVSFCKKLLLEARVSTTPGAPFGPTGEQHLRITFCSTHEEINKAFDRMEKYFGET